MRVPVTANGSTATRAGFPGAGDRPRCPQQRMALLLVMGVVSLVPAQDPPAGTALLLFDGRCLLRDAQTGVETTLVSSGAFLPVPAGSQHVLGVWPTSGTRPFARRVSGVGGRGCLKPRPPRCLRAYETCRASMFAARITLMAL